MEKIYISLSKLSTFLDNLKTTFATITHKHTISDLTDYTVDTELSSTSTNPVQNKVLNEEFDSVATAMNALEVAIDTNLETTKSYADTGDTITLEAAKAYADEHDVPVFNIAYDSENSTYYLADVTFDELYSYALQGKIVALSKINTGQMYYYIKNASSSDNATIYLYYGQLMSGNACYYCRIDNNGNFNLYSSTMMKNSNPTGTGYFSLNRKSGTTIGQYSVATGWGTEASGVLSYAGGYSTVASGYASHAQGMATIASGNHSYSEGFNTTASGAYSHAQGRTTKASGLDSHAEGYETIASGNQQHAQGKCNIEDAEGYYAHIVGNGPDSINRSNAYTLDWDGNAWFAGDVYVGSTSGTNKDDGSVKLATLTEMQTYVDEAVSQNETKADVDHTHDDKYYTEEEIDAKVATLESTIANKASSSHTHDDIYYTEGEIDEKIATLNTSISNSTAEAKNYSNENLASAKTYTDEAVSTKTQIQFITLEDGD